MSKQAELVSRLIKENNIRENDVIKHSYTEQILSGKKKSIESHNIMPTFTTRVDCLGVVVSNNRINNKDYYQPGAWKTKSDPKVTNSENDLRIRKLTPTECFRLMGVKDEDSSKLNELSNMVKYHLAGDSIVTTVLMAIFGELLDIDWKEKIKEVTKW